MKRKVMFAALGVLLISLSVTGGTFAYLTAQTTGTNTLTTGKINIAIVQNFNPEDTRNLAPTSPENPKKVQKEVRIQNQGGEAFVRVKLMKSWGRYGEDNQFVVNPELSTENIMLYFKDQSKWQRIDDYYYTKLDAAEPNKVLQSDVLLESFSLLTLNGEMDQMYKGNVVQIDVVADAIQVGNQAIDAEWGISYNPQTGVFAEVVKQQQP